MCCSWWTRQLVNVSRSHSNIDHVIESVLSSVPSIPPPPQLSLAAVRAVLKKWEGGAVLQSLTAMGTHKSSCWHRGLYSSETIDERYFHGSLSCTPSNLFHCVDVRYLQFHAPRCILLLFFKIRNKYHHADKEVQQHQDCTWISLRCEGFNQWESWIHVSGCKGQDYSLFLCSVIHRHISRKRKEFIQPNLGE